MSSNPYTITLDRNKKLTAVYVEVAALSIDAGGPYTGNPDVAVQFACTPLGGVVPYAFLWNFGDGGTSTLQNPTHVYAAVGVFTVGVQVTDSTSATASDTATATITAVTVLPPVAAFTYSPASPSTNDAIAFNASSSYPQQSGATITNYAWNFGDGTTASGVTVNKTYAASGSYNVVLTVTDSNGQTDTEPKTVVVTVGVTTITLNVVAETGGSVSPSGALPLTVGVSYQFNETENVGYDFLRWDLAGVSKGSSTSLVLLITADMNGQTLTAKFTTEPPPQITMTLTVAGNGSTDITGPQTFNVGDVVVITAIPQTGATFNGWKLDGAAYSTDNPLSLTVTADLNGKTLTADFTTLIPAGFPLWVIVAGVGGTGALIGGILLTRKGRKSRG